MKMKTIAMEGFIKNSPNPVTIEGTEKILFQMKNCVCKIHGKIKGTGFFCKIPFPNQENLKPFLLTNNHILNSEDIKEEKSITISINNETVKKSIKIDNSRIVFTSAKLDVTFIEIKQKDGINNFLELDDNISEDDELLNDLYSKESIYILQYPEGNDIVVSYGLLHNLNDEIINHKCNTKEGSSGSPILSLKTFKLIGIHNGNNSIFNINQGIFIKYPIDEFNKNKHSDNSSDDIYFNFKNIEKIYEINCSKIQNLLILDNTYIFIKSLKAIEIFSLKNYNCLMTINLKVKPFEDYEFDYIYIVKNDDNNSKLKIRDIKIVTKKYYIQIDIENKKWKILNYLENGYYLSNLDILMFYINNLNVDKRKIGDDIRYITMDPDELRSKPGYSDYPKVEFKFNFINKKGKKIKNKDFIIKSGFMETFEINGRYLVCYIYIRYNSTTMIIDMKNNYQLIYEKEFEHWFDDLKLLDNNTLFLKPNFLFDIENLSEKTIKLKLDYYLVHKFNNNYYLGYDDFSRDLYSGILKEKKGEYELIEKEKGHFGQQLNFLDNYIFLSWTKNEDKIIIYSYLKK